MLADPHCLGNLPDTAGEALFDPQFWAARGALGAVSAGRGAAWFVDCGPRQWVLRHYRRGGFMARIAHDQYLWGGEGRVRAFAEYRILERLTSARSAGSETGRGALPAQRCDLSMRSDR